MPGAGKAVLISETGSNLGSSPSNVICQPISHAGDIDGLVDELGYQTIYFCEVCRRQGRKVHLFKKLSSLKRHFLKHHPGYELEYSRKVVSASYIRDKMENCSSHALVFGHVHGTTCEYKKKIPIRCGVRMCPKCENYRVFKAIRKYEEAVFAMKHPSLLTLTFRGHHPLSNERKLQNERFARNFIKRLHRKLKKMPHAPPLSYIRAYEFVEKEDGYYYHYHYLIDMPYVDQKWLSKIWKEVTKDSYIVDIRRVGYEPSHELRSFGDPDKKEISSKAKKEALDTVVDYLSKPLKVSLTSLSRASKHLKKKALHKTVEYLSKPLGINDIDDKLYDLYARELYGRHLAESRGLLHLINGQNSSTLICPICGDDLFLMGIEPTETHIISEDPDPPPPSCENLVITHLFL